MPAVSDVRDELGMGTVEVFPLPPDEPTLRAILSDLFERWWPSIRFGPAIEGAVFEGRADGPPRLTMLDGYLTVDLGSWHLHLCIGEHRGLPGSPVGPELARLRRCSRAELFRRLHEGAPVSWGLRLFNGDGEQQITVWFPSPFLDDDQELLDPPAWDRLDCWDHVRRTYLDLEPDGLDRAAPGFHHG